MTYLAFDPQLLAAARQRAAGLPEGLARLRSPDPLASAANDAVRAMIDQLVGEWIPLIDRVLNCPALTRAEQRTVAPTDLQRAVLDEVVARRWRLAEDAEHRFTGDEGDRHLTDEDAEIVWLAQALTAIGADERLAETFTAEFSAWPAFTAWVSARWVELVSAAREEPAAAEWTARQVVFDRLLTAMATIVARSTPAVVPPPLLDSMTPYAAALLVARMDLDPALRANLTAELINRYWDGDPQRRHVAVERIGDVLLPAVLATPGSAFTVLELVDPAALYFAALDTSLTAGVLQAAADLAVPTHRASAVLTKFLDHAAGHGEYAVPPGIEFQVDAALAAMAAPWLGWICTRFAFLGWTEAERDRRLGVIVATEQARAVLLDSRGQWVHGLVGVDLVDDDGRPHTILVEEVSETLNLVLARMRRAQVSEGRQSVFIGDIVEKLASLAPQLISMKRPGMEQLAKETVGRTVDSFVDWARRNGVLPPTKEGLDEQAAAAWRRRSLDGKVYVVVLTLALMEHRGGLPAGFVARIDLGQDDTARCEPQRIHDRLIGLARQPGLTIDQRNDITAVVNTLLNDGEASHLCP